MKKTIVSLIALTFAAPALAGEIKTDIKSDQNRDTVNSTLTGADGDGANDGKAPKVQTQGEVSSEVTSSSSVPVSGDPGPSGDATAGGTLKAND